MSSITLRSHNRATPKTLTLLLCASFIPLAMPSLAVAQTSSNFDEIIVTGSPLSNSVNEAITGVSVLSGDELADRLAGSIGETLKTEPGVSSTFFGAGASRPIIRGQGGDRVRVLNNGIGSIDASSASPDHAVATEPAQAERIEVVRGASILRYGSSGSGGIVNVIDGRIPSEIPENGREGAVRIGATSVDSGFEAAASIDQALGKNFVLHLDGTWRDTNDFRIPGFAESEALREAEHEDEDDDHDEDEHEEEEEEFGRLSNSSTQSTSFTGGLSYIGERGFIGIAIQQSDREYGIPGGHGHEEEEEGHDEEEEEEEVVSIDLDQTRIDINAARDFDGFIERVQFFGGYADYEHTEFEGDEIGTVFANEGWEARLELIQAEQSGWKAAYGVQLRDRDFSAIGEEAFVPPTNTSQIGLFTYHQKEINNLHFEAAGRYEHTTQENTTAGQELDFDLFSVSAGGDIHITETFRLGGTVFRTERAPTTEELFSDGPHLATGQFEQGDIGLEKETSTGVEFAVRHNTESHYASVNLFYTDYEDYIYERETGLIEDELPIFQFTAEDATFRGFEVQAGSDIGTWNDVDFSIDALAEYVDAEVDSGNLPRIPPLSILAGVEARRNDMSLRTEIDYAAEQNSISFGETPTDSYSHVNVFFGWSPEISDQSVKLSLSVLNLFDTEGRQHTSFLKDVVPLPGRNFRASLSAKF